MLHRAEATILKILANLPSTFVRTYLPTLSTYLVESIISIPITYIHTYYIIVTDYLLTLRARRKQLGRLLTLYNTPLLHCRKLRQKLLAKIF